MMFMHILARVPFYSEIPYIINSAIVLLISLAFVYYGNQICGEKTKQILRIYVIDRPTDLG